MLRPGCVKVVCGRYEAPVNSRLFKEGVVVSGPVEIQAVTKYQVVCNEGFVVVGAVPPACPISKSPAFACVCMCVCMCM